MKLISMRLMMFALILALLTAACSSSTRVSPPDIVNTWKPPAGVEAAPPVSCAEIRSLFKYDPQAPLDFQEEKRQRDGGLTVIEFNYASPMGGRVPAILIVPDGKGPFAGIVFMHGSGGSRWDLRELAKVYARLGTVGITIGAPSSRPEHNSFDAFTFEEKDRREQIQLMIDLRRAIDVLLTLPQVDPQRLAYIGISYGGAMGGLLAGVEDRLKGYTLMVGDGGLVTHFNGAMIMGQPEKLRQEWLTAMWPIEPIHYVGCAAPAALLFQNGTLDKQVRPADALRYQQAGSEPKTTLWYKAGHALPQQAYQDQADWLRRIIGIASYRMAFPGSVRVFLVIWFLLTAGSLAFLILDLWHTWPVPRGACLLWFLTIVFLGPLGMVIYWLSGRKPRETRESVGLNSYARRALGSAAWATAGNMCGGLVVLTLLLYFQPMFGSNPVVLITTIIITPFCVNQLIIAASRWLSRSDECFLKAYRRPFLIETISSFLVLVGAYPTWVELLNRYVGPWVGPFSLDLSYAPLWGCVSLAALAGILITYPFHLWMIWRGVIRWGATIMPDEEPVRKLKWYQQAALVLMALAGLLYTLFLSFGIA